MEISFLGNGLAENNRPVSKVIKESLLDTDFKAFITLSAFTSISGLGIIIDELYVFKENGGLIEFYLGVDEGVTNKPTLEEYMKLDVSTYIYFNKYMLNSPQKPIFHPKLYIFQGKKTRVIIGSANLTSKGLERNVETSVKIDFDNNDIDGIRFLNDILSFFKPLLQKTSNCLQPLSNDLIANLLENGIIHEKAIYYTRPKEYNQNKNEDTLVFDLVKPPYIPKKLNKKKKRTKEVRKSYGVYESMNVYSIQSHSDIYGSYSQFLESMKRQKTVSYYYIPQGVHLGHLFYIVHSYYTGNIHNRIKLMYESTSSNNGTIVRQTRYKMCFGMELLLISDDRQSKNTDLESLELLPNGMILAKLLERNTKDENFYKFKQGNDSISWDMVLNPEYYIEWVRSLPILERNELFLLFNNFTLLRILMEYLRERGAYNEEEIYTKFWDYKTATNYLSLIGVERPTSRSSLEHRMPFVISLLNAFDIIESLK